MIVQHPRPVPAPTAPLRVHGHFGELLQGRLGAGGPLALVSLPCPALWVEPGDPGDSALIGPRRVQALCAALGLPPPANLPRLHATMPPGGGAGSSTAALVAVARLLGFDGPAEGLARACVAAEGASDPLMFPRAERLLFAPRLGQVLRPLPALPRFVVAGGFLGPGQRTRAEDEDFPDIADLVARWDQGLNLRQMAGLASESARRTLALRGPSGDPTADLARDLGAEGWLIAHTGSARGLILDPDTATDGVLAALIEAGFTDVLTFAGGGA